MTGSTTSSSDHSRGNSEINYRRFFAITTSCRGARWRIPEVLAATACSHPRPGARHGIAGLRIDHPDGLRDPARLPEIDCDRLPRSSGSPWRRSLRPGEELPTTWPVAGTTGLRRHARGEWSSSSTMIMVAQLHGPLSAADRRPRARSSDHIEAGKRLAVAHPAAGRGATDGGALGPTSRYWSGACRDRDRASRFTAPTCPKELLILITPLATAVRRTTRPGQHG